VAVIVGVGREQPGMGHMLAEKAVKDMGWQVHGGGGACHNSGFRGQNEFGNTSDGTEKDSDIQVLEQKDLVI
jgi:hypothetical protein